MKGVCKHMKVKWLLKKISTTIYDNRSNIEFAAGTLMVIAGTAMVISKAEKAVEVKDEMDRKIKNIELKDEYEDWDSKSQRTKECVKMAKETAIGYLKVYGPGLAVEVGGLTLMGISHATDRKEIATVSAALASTALEFANYRARVKEEFGEEKDEEFLMGKPVVEEKDGKVTITPATIPKHSFMFDSKNPNHSGDPMMDLDYLENHERWLNMRLQKEGILWENDIRRDIKADIDPEADGWGITAVDDDGNTNYISLGLNKNTERAKAFREGKTDSFLIILDNMEPNISKKMYRLMKYHRDWDCELIQ